ncbi:MAG: hypothetical protein FWC50_02160, partial [Planctomycetaceae bacterium]|nr:hypothetical protein [Planctomycetaceae bacterium]
MSCRVFPTVVLVTMFLLTVPERGFAAEEEKTFHVVTFPAFPEIRWNIPEMITLTVVNEAGKPLAEMQASFSITDMPKEGDSFSGLNQPTGRFEISDLVTDANGKIVIEIPVQNIFKNYYCKTGSEGCLRRNGTSIELLAWTKKFRTKLKKFRSSSYGGHDDHATTSING